MEVELARVEALLTALIVLQVVLGWRAAKRERPRLHRALMLGAVLTSAVFLIPFVGRLAEFGLRPFRLAGPWNTVYWVVFATHDLAALLSVPVILVAAGLGLAERKGDHRDVSAIALPLWLYSLVTGLALYVLLFEV
jgi:putative membrane protein